MPLLFLKSLCIRRCTRFGRSGMAAVASAVHGGCHSRPVCHSDLEVKITASTVYTLTLLHQPYTCQRGWNCVATTCSYGTEAVSPPNARVNRPQFSPCQCPQALERLKRYDPQTKKLACMRSIRHCRAHTPVYTRHTVGHQCLSEDRKSVV